MSARRTGTILGLLITLCACSSAPDPILYTLASSTISTGTFEDGRIIGLSELELPAYARNQQITTAMSAYQIYEDDNHRWASPPSEALTSALSKALERSAGQTVLQRPYPAGVRPEVRVSISFDRLLRGANGHAEMSGQYLVQFDRGATRVKRFSISAPSTDSSYQAYMSALSRGLLELADQIGEELKMQAES